MALHKQSWFWSALATLGLVAGVFAAHVRETTRTESSLTDMRSRITAIEEVKPSETRWMVDRLNQSISEIRGDVAGIRGSIRNIELNLARQKTVGFLENYETQ